ncbi:MAG TPA: DNA alkylation repair protein, partial [Thermoplasmata archaeon]|nr:DNA alkylation repair protein [Thermoplasmata archaeon]
SAAEIRERIQAERGPPPKIDLQAYCGSPLPVLGVSVPRLRRLARDLIPRWGRPASAAVRERAAELWQGSTFEERLLAIELLGRWGDADWRSTWRLADGWVESATGWALSDALSLAVLGPLVWAHPEKIPVLARWGRSRSPWRRRASVYGLHRFVRNGRSEVLLEHLVPLLGDPEPWVQRAVGTWLREAWKVDPRRSEAFLRAHAAKLPAVVRTVATERAPREFRKELQRRAAHGLPRASFRDSPRPPT